MGRTKIRINYDICGENGKIDPRDCTKCLKACDPAVFIMHPTLGTEISKKTHTIPKIGVSHHYGVPYVSAV